MGVKLSKLTPLVLADIKANNAVEITSASGMGKSEWSGKNLTNTLRNTIWREGSIGMSTLFLATKNPMDLVGVTFKGTSSYTTPEGKTVTFTRTDPALPSWMISTEGKPAWEYDHFLLRLDEYGQGGEDVLKMSAEIMLHGELDKWKLPPSNARIALSNEGAGYGVGKRFHFTTNRMSRYWLDPDPEGWIEHVSKPYEFEGDMWTTLPITIAFGKNHPLDCLYEATPKTPGTPWCSPRSLLMTDRWLQCYIEAMGSSFSADDPNLIAGVQGKIGSASGACYIAHLKYSLEMPSYEEIVADPTGIPVPVKMDHQFILVYNLAAYAKRKDYSALITYVKRCACDMALSFCKTVLARDPAFVADKDYKTWALQNGGLLALMNAA